MKTLSFFFIILAIGLCCSCGEWETPTETKPEMAKPITVTTTTVESLARKETKAFYGTLKFSRSTDFVAQQPGILKEMNVSPGQKVSKGQVLAVFPPIHHDLQVAQARIQLNKTQEDYRRQKELYRIGAVAKTSLGDLKTQLEIEQKVLEQLESVNIIKAPFNGTITQVYTVVGQEVGMQMPLLSMAQPNTVNVEFYAIPEDMSSIHLQAPVYFLRGERRMEGKVFKRAIQIDERRKAFLITASFENSNIDFVGNTVDVLVETGAMVQSIEIPVEALRKQGNSHYVFLMKGGKAVKQKVNVARRNEERAQIKSGLQAGDQLIVSGIDKLKSNTIVRPIQN